MAPPGVRFLLGDVPKYLLPLELPLLVHVVVLVLLRVYNWTPSVGLIILVWLFVLPVYHQARSTYTHFIHVREARRLEARLVPKVKGKLPANVDLLYKGLMKKTLYLGDGLIAWTQTHGTTFSVTTVGDTRIFTINPENLKRILATDFDNYVKGVSFNT